MTEVPTWEHFLAPSLKALSDGELWQSRDLRESAARALRLSDAARAELIPSGQFRWENRANWALSYLGRYGAADRPTRGRYRITESGRRLLSLRPDLITVHDLADILGEPIVKATSDSTGILQAESELDPVEQIENGIQRIQADVADDLLSRLHKNHPTFFEQAVLDLLMAMGYGGTSGTANRTQLTNDGGIDGVIDQDALGLSRIYVQAKRYALDSTVHRPEVQGFVGALHGKQANQGVFITTARFSAGARNYAESVPTRVVLIDGPRLAALMIRFGVGVQVKRSVAIVEVDEDFFD